MNQIEHESDPPGSLLTPAQREDFLPQSSIAQTRNRDSETNGSGNRPSRIAVSSKKNEELEWARRHVPDDGPAGRPASHPVRNVFRKTELHGTVAASTPDEIRKARRRTLQNLKRPDSVISYQPFEAAFRDFVCSLMERQDATADEMFFHVADLQQQVNALEERLETIRKRVPGETQGRSW